MRHTTRSPLIVGAGIACIDHVAVSPQVHWGETSDVEEFATLGGGLTGTALVACARLGARARIASLLARDWTGERIAKGLREEGVETDALRWFETGESPFSFVHVDSASGERTIFHRRAQGLSWNDAPFSGFEGAAAMVLDGYYPDLARAAVAWAKAHGVPTVADTLPTPENREWLSQVTVLIAPEEALGGDSEERALDAIHDFGPGTAVITRGARGWTASDAKGRYRGDAFAVPVIDTLGAGDVFHGAFAFALAREWETPRCAEFASAVAALKCTQRGGRAGIPSLDAALGFLRQHSQNNWEAAL